MVNLRNKTDAACDIVDEAMSKSRHACDEAAPDSPFVRGGNGWGKGKSRITCKLNTGGMGRNFGARIEAAAVLFSAIT